MNKKFRAAFAATVTLTVLCGVTMGILALVGPDPYPPPVSAFFDTLKLGFSYGMFAVFAQLGISRLPDRQ